MNCFYALSASYREHANHVKQSKQRLLEQIQSHHFRQWDRDLDPEIHCYDTEWHTQLPYFSPDIDLRNHKPTGPWSEMLYVFAVVAVSDNQK